MKIANLLIVIFSCLLATACVSTPADKLMAKPTTDKTFGRYAENIEPELILITMTSSYHEQLTRLEPVPIDGQIPAPYAQFIDGLTARHELTRVANWPLATIEVFCVVFEIQDSANRESVVEALRQEPGVETAQLVQTFATQSENYNDPYLSMQHGVHSLQALITHQWSRGEGVRIAVIDTGIDNAHPELVSSTEAMRNFVDNDDVQFRSDTHGTAVGGVIAANADNETGIVGIAPDAKLLALKACWQNPENPDKAVCNSLTLAKALNYSIQQNVDIINLSLTGPPDPVLERLVAEALERNIIVIGAKPAHDNLAFPISVPGTIAVDMPNLGSGLLTAPGRSVISIRPNEQYDFFDGSSFSTAHITGLAALIRSLSPILPPAAVSALLENTADANTGAANACLAVKNARRAVDGNFPDTVCQ
ncbi:MAG: S8 family serine peptidase [Granulosicoccus sp.]